MCAGVVEDAFGQSGNGSVELAGGCERLACGVVEDREGFEAALDVHVRGWKRALRLRARFERRRISLCHLDLRLVCAAAQHLLAR